MDTGFDAAGRHVVVTGANTGIGRATALALARAGARLTLAGRSEARTRPVLEEIVRLGAPPPAFVTLDLADLASVRRAASQLLSDAGSIDVLVNNAGVGGRNGLTRDGFELTFGTNHLGPFLLTRLLLDRLRASAPARIVTVSSDAHYGARGIDFAALRRPGRSRTGFPEYQVSKLCNVLFSAELARRLEGTGVSTYALHPGVIASDIWREVWAPLRFAMRLFMASPEAGVRTPLVCALDPALAERTGRYWARGREKAPSALAQDAALARRLWEESARWSEG